MFKLYGTQSLRIWTQTTPKRNLLKNVAGHSGAHVTSTLRNPCWGKGTATHVGTACTTQQILRQKATLQDLLSKREKATITTKKPT